MHPNLWSAHSQYIQEAADTIPRLLPDCVNLKQLAIPGIIRTSKVAIQQSITHSVNLTHLCLSSCFYEDALDVLQRQPSLRVVAITLSSSTPPTVPPLNLPHLYAFMGPTNLWESICENSPVQHLSTPFSFSSHLPILPHTYGELRSLSLAFLQDSLSFPELPQLHRIEDLRLVIHCQDGPAELIENLKFIPSPHFHYLGLHSLRVQPDKTCETISASLFAHFPSLLKVDFTYDQLILDTGRGSNTRYERGTPPSVLRSHTPTSTDIFGRWWLDVDNPYQSQLLRRLALLE
ncbi:hypothetical protein ONZ45_g14067 [Pleurotus djamor]|nr:hypothetical protein ONZ45_g14067 [Pleurotus djamor]